MRQLRFSIIPVIFLFFLTLITGEAFSQGAPPPVPPSGAPPPSGVSAGMPIDDHIWLLAVVMVLFAAYQLMGKNLLHKLGLKG